MLVVLHGGDGRLACQIDQIVTAANEAGGADVFKGKSLAYVMVALKPLMRDGGSISQSTIEATVDTVIKPAFTAQGAVQVDLIGSREIDRILTYGCVLLSGGDTAHLLQALAEAGIAARLSSGQHDIKILMGISAGAIALAEAGIGTEAGKVSRFTGMGIVKGCVCPHAATHPERKEMARDTTPLGAAAAVYTVSLSKVF